MPCSSMVNLKIKYWGLKIMRDKKIICYMIMIFSMLLVFAGCSPQKTGEIQEEPQMIHIVCGFPGGTWTPQSVLWAALISSQVPNVKASSLPGGTDSNLKAVQAGDALVGWSYGANTYDALNGLGSFEKKCPDIRHMMTLQASAVHFAVTRNSKIQKLDDLATCQARVSLGGRGFMTDRIFRAALDVIGVTEEDLQKNGGYISYTPFDDAVRMMQDGSLDIWVAHGDLPLPEIQSLEMTPGIRLIEMTDEQLNGIKDRVKGLNDIVIEAEYYPATLKKSVKSVGARSHVIVNASATEELVYQLIKVYWDNIDQIYQLGQWATSAKLEDILDGAVAEIHPGALKYYNKMVDNN